MRGGRVPAFGPGLAALMVVGGLTEALVAHLSTPPEDRIPSEELIAQTAGVIGRMAGE